jgi:hypothetical protein
MSDPDLSEEPEDESSECLELLPTAAKNPIPADRAPRYALPITTANATKATSHAIARTTPGNANTHERDKTIPAANNASNAVAASKVLRSTNDGELTKERLTRDEVQCSDSGMSRRTFATTCHPQSCGLDNPVTDRQEGPPDRGQ